MSAALRREAVSRALAVCSNLEHSLSRIARVWRLYLILAVCLLVCLDCRDPDQLGAWVPPTADQDPQLPRVRVRIDGTSWWLHAQTFGDPENPPLFVLPGGPGADFRLLLPLRALSDRYFVVMWDVHGAGLSQRASTPEQLEIDGFDRELAAMQAELAPDRKIGLIGHSFGAEIATRYAARHPERVAQLILVEPGPLTAAAREHRETAWLTLSSIQSVFWDNEVITSADHEQADYRLLGALRAATYGFYCDDQEPEEYPIWRFSAYSLEMVPRNEGDLDYTRGLGDYAGSMLVIAGSCGELGAGFQRRWQLPALERAEFVEIEGAGHITLFLEHRKQTVEAIRAFLDQHSEEP